MAEFPPVFQDWSRGAQAGWPPRQGATCRGARGSPGVGFPGVPAGPLVFWFWFCFPDRLEAGGESYRGLPPVASRAAGSPGGPPGIFPWRSGRPPGNHNANADKTVFRFVCGRGKNRNSTIWGRFPAQPGPGGAWAPAGAPLDVHRFSVATSSAADAAQTGTPKQKNLIPRYMKAM